MPLPAILGAAAPIAGGLIGKAIGGGGPSNAQPALPKDLQGLRGNQIGLLQYLLGFNQQGSPWSPQQPPPASQGGPIQRGQTRGSQAPGGYNIPGLWTSGQANAGQQPSMNVGTASPMPGGFNPVSGQAGGQGGNDMLGRLESYFGQLGTPTTDLQRQSLGGISQFLNSDPYGQSNNWLSQVAGGSGYNEANQAYRDVGNANYFGGAQNAFGTAGGTFGQAGDAFSKVGGQNLFGQAQGVFNRLEGFNPFGAAQTSMEGILAKNPGMQGMDALKPLLERNLAAANQEGGRFGSANAILRSRAVDDNNLLASQMYQRGVDQQIGAAGQYGAMGNSLIGARNMAGQGMLGVGQGRLQQGLGAAQGMLGVGQGQLGVGNGMLGVGQGRLSQGMGMAGGLAGLAQALQGDRLQAAGGMTNNANSQFNAYQGAYNTGSQQANQEAQRQQQATQMLQQLLGASFGPTFGAPTVVSPTGAQQGAQMGSDFASMIPLLMASGGAGGGSGNVWGPASQYGF